MNRIPFGKNGSKSSADRKSVLLQHGLLGSSASFVISGNQSLGFFFFFFGNFHLFKFNFLKLSFWPIVDLMCGSAILEVTFIREVTLIGIQKVTNSGTLGMYEKKL